MKSMTGFGNAWTEIDNHHIYLTLKTLNSRYLDIVIFLPPILSDLEIRIREQILQKFQRGRIEVNIHIDNSEDDICITINKEMVNKWMEVLMELKELTGDEKPISMDILADKEGIFNIDKQPVSEKYWAGIENLLLKSEEQVYNYREREGASLSCDIGKHLDSIDTTLSEITELAPRIKDEIEKSFRSRFMSILGDEINERHVVNETAAWITKYDINEEIVRLQTHIAVFRKDMDSLSPIGKKLDFLVQEMTREVNTIGSKTPRAEISHLVVVMKNALECIREQLRNVE